MDFSNMLMQSVKGFAVSRISSMLGLDNTTTKNITAKALPLILDKLNTNTNTEEGATSLNNALNSHLGDTDVKIEDGQNILGHIFSNSDNVVEEVSKQVGASRSDTNGVMSGLSSLIMEKLGDQKKASGGFSNEELQKLLSGTGKDANMFSIFDQDGDGDMDMQDGLTAIKNKLFG